MSVPSHGPFCRTQTFDWHCPFCQSEIVVLKCTCGSHVWFSDGWLSWTRHHCDGTRDGIRRLGPGNSGLLGWTAISVLRKIGIEIDADIWDKHFPEDGRTSAEPAPHILRVAPDRRTKKRIWPLSAISTRRLQPCPKPWTRSRRSATNSRGSTQRPATSK